ncbi:uncharacterized protein LOC105645997 isoform X2 [Jatropha curcas]|uniref:uncharacterized protein LOC105645997 isoform X2 n=1 Tax=Jatropha curcas TaxID=180498 RepID=UPI0005FAA986|nr:uncharacterized protein LOC105645997 isoform X2 [Jatropha curcas]XP_020539638.1 uncharacterized protein LOC105645997 isoform X2 [Jatropha curcas]XP_020539639.1 uncharacterized protein LOC105645997 isoform X2 [Jatropha curcas]XP_020539640.1 uncharacterized protein LOC105645997 isoform X2 [Jatropha curcas]
MHLFNCSIEKMMMQGEFDINPVQIYTDSLKEVLKQTMINQDVVFRNQVHELHRLYSVQESLMKDYGWKECNGYCSWNPKAQSSLLPLTNHTRYKSPAKQTRFLTTEVDSTPLLSQEVFKDCEDAYYKLQHRSLDLQLSADEFINNGEENIPMKGNVQNSLEGPVDFKLPILGDNSPNAEELKLSLSTGVDNRTVGHTTRTCFTKKSFSCSQNVIDLEELKERILDRYVKCPPPLGRACLEVHSKGKHDSQTSDFPGPDISISIKKDLSHEIAESSSIQEYSECYQEQTFSNEGNRECHDDVPSNDHFTEMQQFTLYRGQQFDLNKVHLDDDSCCSDDHMLVYPSTASSKGNSHGLAGSMHDGTCPTAFQGNKVNQFSNGVSAMLKQDNIVNLALANSNRENKSADNWTRNTGIISSPESIIRTAVDISEDLGCCSGHKNGIDELKSKLAREVSSEKSEIENALFSCNDQSQNTCQDGHGNKSPSSCKSYCISDNDSSSAKTKYSGITSGVLKTQLGSQVGDVISGEHDQKTCDGIDIKNDCYTKKEESANVDVLIKEAAEMLIQISAKCSASHQYLYAKVGSKQMEDDKREQTQCSCDSFELMTLNLTESNLDDNSVSSKPIEVDDIETKDFGFKFRRGRRMKDFQKEILPSLASLSRHEILEDINIMEGVLRSREYRKMRAKMAAHVDNWVAPVRSRRSRTSYAGRRNFS